MPKKKEAGLVLRFGALGPKLSEQLEGFVDPEHFEFFDRAADGITLLKIHSLLTEAEALKARQRLMKLIEQRARQYDPSQVI